jgi:quinol monooxygenase YgiN
MKSLLLASILALGLVATTRPATAADAPATAPATPAARVFVHHEVADYAAWRKAYNAFAPMRRKFGVTAQAVYQSVDNPNDVVVTHDFASADQAKAFVASDELKAAMQKAGVKGAPQVWITTKAAK